MDTGSNGQMLQLNTESIGEVKILTQGYQAEFGRSSGLQITAVTKSGSNQFRGSLYDVERNSDWNANTWVNQKNGDPKPLNKEKDWGYSLGGPIGKPGGENKLFFFYSHEYRPRNNPINNGNPIRLRVPTALERAGDFSQSLDNNGAAIPQLLDPITRAAVPGQPHSGGSPVPDGPRRPEPVSAAEHSAGGRDELQLRSRAAEGRKPDSAAGHPHRLSAAARSCA